MATVPTLINTYAVNGGLKLTYSGSGYAEVLIYGLTPSAPEDVTTMARALEPTVNAMFGSGNELTKIELLSEAWPEIEITDLPA